MKEADYSYDNIFNGLLEDEVADKKKPRLETCHNITPIKDNYHLHVLLIDMNANGVPWGT